MLHSPSQSELKWRQRQVVAGQLVARQSPRLVGLAFGCFLACFCLMIPFDFNDHGAVSAWSVNELTIYFKTAKSSQITVPTEVGAVALITEVSRAVLPVAGPLFYFAGIYKLPWNWAAEDGPEPTGPVPYRLILTTSACVAIAAAAWGLWSRYYIDLRLDELGYARLIKWNNL